MLLQFRRPFKAPYEPIHVALADNDTFIFRSKHATRLVLPADCSATNYWERDLVPWNQSKSIEQGNQWRPTAWSGGYRIGTTYIVSGSSVVFHSVTDYTKSNSRICGRSGYYNWTHDKTNHKYSFEFYLDNDREESNPNLTDGQSDSNEKCLYDDDESFWEPHESATGSYGITISEEATEKTKGTSSLKMVISTGTSANCGVKHVYDTDRDWSDQEFICLYLYGANTGLTFRILIYAPDSANYFKYDGIIDNFTGWKRFVVPLNKFSVLGAPSWSTVRIIYLFYLNVNQSFTSYLDRTILDVGQWVKVESYVPDELNINVNNVKLSAWTGSAWADFLYGDVIEDQLQRGDPSYLYFLDGTRGDEIYPNGPACMSLYLIGERGQTKNALTGLSGSINYSSYYGCLKRIGFAIKMPPDDGQDSSTSGISQCKLKLEVYYDKVDVDYSPYELYGAATYKFENSTDQYYGLQNINDSWIAFFDPNSNEVEFLIFSQRPLGLKVRADENELIDQIEVTLKKGTIVYAGQTYHGDPTRDTDGDGVPDFLAEFIPKLVMKRDYKGWQ